MSDFLSSLVSKSLNVAPIIQPRPVSLFEPWQPEGAPDLASSIDLGETDRALPLAGSGVAAQTRFDDWPRHEPHDRFTEVPRMPSASGVPTPDSTRPSPVAAFQAVLAPATVAAVPAKDDVSHERSAPIAQTAPTPIDATRAVSSVTSILGQVIVDRGEVDRDRVVADHSTDEHNVPPSVLPVVERLERVTIDHRQADRDRAAIDHREQEPALPLMSTSPAVQRVNIEPERSAHTRSAPLSAIETIGDKPAPGTSPSPRLTPLIERVDRVRESRESRETDQVNLAQPSQSTIHVTIGRIEVRATPAAAPIKRASPPATTMTLEEYLRSRAGDRR